ncbi:hypothetical protein D770_04330 [Flammeovirgaceae bacterium 311]|nr:hypothetical protein D770_04330 [Flammeovirgaceae bacterium 311]
MKGICFIQRTLWANKKGMPTIEIASINSTGLDLRQEDYDVAIIEENRLESHRGLFNKFLSKQDGSIVHLGNADFKEDKEGGFFGGQLIDWDFESGDIIIPHIDPDNPADSWGANQQHRFKFHEQFKPDIDRILNIALESSPVNKVYFLTDYQFGPSKARTEIIYTITDLWDLHDKEGLIFNTLYELYKK